MPSQALRASSPRGRAKAGGQSRQPLHSELMVRRKPEDRADVHSTVENQKHWFYPQENVDSGNRSC